MIKKIVIYIIFVISTLILIYSLYRSEIVFNGKKRDFYSIYIILSIAGFLLTWYLNRLSQNLFLSILIYFFVFSLSIYSFEFYSTYLINKNLSNPDIKKKN